MISSRNTNILIGGLILVIAIYIIKTSPVGLPSLSSINIFANKQIVEYSCTDLPDIEKVNTTVAQKADTIKKVEDIDSGVVRVIVDSVRCPKKGELIIVYGNDNNKKRIENLLGKDFYGIPYKMQKQ